MKKAYEFALLRYTHNAMAAETVNVGVVLLVPEDGQLYCEIPLSYGRLSQFFADFSGKDYRAMLSRVRARITRFAQEVAPLELQTDKSGFAEEYRLDDLLPKILTQTNCFSWSEVMSGIARDPAQRLRQLTQEFVDRHEKTTAKPRRDDEQIARNVAKRLCEKGLLNKLTEVPMSVDGVDHCFRFGWMNGTRQVMDSISLDYADPSRIKQKANEWSGILYNLSKGEPFQFTGVVSAYTRGLDKERDRAMAILQKAPNVRKIITEAEIDRFIPEIEADLAHEH